MSVFQTNQFGAAIEPEHPIVVNRRTQLALQQPTGLFFGDSGTTVDPLLRRPITQVVVDPVIGAGPTDVLVVDRPPVIARPGTAIMGRLPPDPRADPLVLARPPIPATLVRVPVPFPPPPGGTRVIDIATPFATIENPFQTRNYNTPETALDLRRRDQLQRQVSNENERVADDLDDSIRDLDAKLSRLYISQRTLARDSQATIVEKRAVQADIIKTGTDIDALRKRQQRSAVSTPVVGLSRTPSRPSTPQRRLGDANEALAREEAILRERRRALQQAPVVPVRRDAVQIGASQSFSAAEREMASKINFVLGMYRREIQDKITRREYDADETRQAQYAIHYIDWFRAQFAKQNVPLVFPAYEDLIKNDGAFRAAFSEYVTYLETLLEEQVDAGQVSEDSLDGWRMAVVERFNEDVDEYVAEPGTFGFGLAGAFQGLGNWLRSLVVAPANTEKAIAAQGLEETSQAANSIATRAADAVERQVRHAETGARDASLDALSAAIIANRARQIQQSLGTAAQIDAVDDIAQRDLGAQLARGDRAGIARAQRNVAITSAADEQNRRNLLAFNAMQEEDANAMARSRAAHAAKMRADAAALDFTKDTLVALPRQVAGVAQKSQDAINRAQAANTSLDVIVPSNRMRFYSLKKRDVDTPVSFAQFFNATFSLFRDNYQLTDNKNGTSTFTIKRLSEDAAHTLVALLFADILFAWTSERVTSAQDLKTKVWVETLVPFLALVIREATALKQNRAKSNEFVIQFWNELRASVSWLFCLAVTGITAPPNTAADYSRSQQFQPLHAAAPTAFKTLGVDFDSEPFREAETQNQLLSRERDAITGATPSDGVSSPILKMLETLPQIELSTDGDVRQYVANIFCLPLFNALYEKELREKFRVENYEAPKNSVRSGWPAEYGVLYRFIGQVLYNPPGAEYTSFNAAIALPAEPGDDASNIDRNRAFIVQQLQTRARIAVAPSVYTRDEFNEFDEDVILAVAAQELASFAYTVFTLPNIPTEQKVRVVQTVVGIVMFAPFRLLPDDENDTTSLWTRFGKRPHRVVTDADGNRRFQYMQTAGKAQTTQRSQFRPSWFPVRFGGQSKQLLGDMISKSTIPELKAFRREMEKDVRIAALLNDESNGYEITVIVPSSEALLDRSVQTMLRDKYEDSLNLFEYHVLDDLLDLPEMSKRSQKMHTVQTEFEQLPVKFSVNPGFTSQHGGSLTLGENTSVFGDGKTMQIISGPYRAKNGAFYIGNAVLDHKKALRQLGRIERQPQIVLPRAQLPPPLVSNLPPPPEPLSSLLEEEYDFPLAPNGPLRTSAKADYVAGRIAIAPDRQQRESLQTSAKKKSTSGGYGGKRLFGSVHETRKQELVMKNVGRTRARHSMKSRGRRTAQRSEENRGAKQHSRSLMAMRMLLEATGVDKKIYAIEQAGRRPIVILAPTQEVLDGIDFSALSFEEQVAIIQQHVLFVNWRGEEATDNDLLTPTALESLFKNDVSKTSFETFNGRRAPNVEILPDAQTNEKATPGANVLRRQDFEMPIEKIVYQDGIPGKPRFPTYIYFICKSLVPTSYETGNGNKTTITTSTRAMNDPKKLLYQTRAFDAEFLNNHKKTVRKIRTAKSGREATDAVNALIAVVGGDDDYIVNIMRLDWKDLMNQLYDALERNRYIQRVESELKDVYNALYTLGEQFDLQPNERFITQSATKKQLGQSLSSPASSEFISDHTDTERVVRNAREAREAIDALGALRVKANQKYLYLAGVSRSTWDRLVKELNNAAWANRFLVGEDLRKVQEAIGNLGQQYDRQPVDGQQRSVQTNARQFISLFVDYQKDAVRLIQRARSVAEALDAVRQLINSIYERDHYLVSITRGNWDRMIAELHEAVDVNANLTDNDRNLVKDEINLLATYYNSQPRDDIGDVINIRVPLEDTEAMAARMRAATTQYIDRDGDGLIDTVVRTAGKPQQQQQQKSTSAHASPLKPLPYELPRDAKVHAQEWLTEFERSTGIMARTNDFDKFTTQFDRLNEQLDRLGGAKTVETEADRERLLRIFDGMESAIARNRHIDVSYKDEAREALYNLQKRFGL